MMLRRAMMAVMAAVRKILHTITSATGLVSFSTNLAEPLEKCECEFSPVQSGSGDPSPDNVRPITGWTGIKVTRTGKNLFSTDEYLAAGAVLYSDQTYPDTYYGNKRAFFRLHGAASSDPNATGLIGRRPFGQITISYYKVIANNDRVYFHYTDATDWVNHSGNISTAGYKTFTSDPDRICDGVALDTTQGATATFAIGALQIEIGDTKTDYETYNGTITPVSWTSEAGTVYGGTLDVTTGVLTVTHSLFAPTGTGTYNNGNKVQKSGLSGVNSYYFMATVSSTANRTSSAKAYCNALKFDGATTAIADTSPNTWFYATDQLRFSLPLDSDIQTADAANAWIASTGLTFVQALATPTTYQLTPAEVATLKGQNTIWHDGNGAITVDYYDSQ